jgi:primosomal replication protein N
MGALRYTPAGIPTLQFRLRHESEQAEAGGRRKVSAEVAAVAFDAQARLIRDAALDRALKLEGFLCARSRRSKTLVLHVTKVEFTEGA